MKQGKNISIWFIGLLFGIFSSLSMNNEFEDTLHRINDADIPDTPTAYLMGGYICMLLGLFFNIIVFLIFLILILSLKKQLDIKYFFIIKSESIGQKIVHILGYMLILAFIYYYAKSLVIYHEWIVSEFTLYITSIITTAFYIIILVSILSKKENR